MLVNEPSLAYLEHVHQQMGLPEPLLYGHGTGGHINGLIEGWIHPAKYLAQIEHMVVLPHVVGRERFRVMMQMSRDCIELLHARGLKIVLSILKSDDRSGLHAWAKRMRFVPYDEDDTVVWFIYVPKEGTPDGQEVPSDAEGESRRAGGSERERAGEGERGTGSDQLQAALPRVAE